MLTWATILFVVVAGRCTVGAAMGCNGGGGKATYRLKVQYVWTSNRFSEIPPFPHFSPLVLFSHTGRFSAFSRFGYATAGVKDVAELGATTKLEAELTAAAKNGLVGDAQVDRRVLGPQGAVTLNVDVSCKHRFVSAITMIAPSPDWILAIFRLPVVSKRGAFISQMSGTLGAYDAGTDSGESFTAPNLESKPRQNIAPIFGHPFDGKWLARYTLEKV